ncbi:FMN-dependent NADH-azoreductase [Streptomyces sp. VRA16 Mangrove soil]|uniref:FMN-dependent NADH-azoreductase n=1 Tax=Streptomyces sp. VRA16 Mangrove soil TaxID=2817434 RepID=UPI001A9FEA83|nr:NAD(P)H-dependent oxidoreductase [Streptomyces sp. VRA16 Mangrove soil]MBO1337776.1 NAD(P)H-dependent oxidoreductase [Streptomyces sp. VRA16 Mangrove soil]
MTDKKTSHTRLLLRLDAGAHDSDASVTRGLSALFARRWQAAHPGARHRYRDLVAEPVPLIDTSYCAFGRKVERYQDLPADGPTGLVESAAEARVWAMTRPYVDELAAADTVVIGAPLYNYSVSAHLKAWIDRVAFPGAFTDPSTGRSRLARTRVVVISARGGDPADGRDFQTPCLRAWFRRLGVTDERLHFVQADRTLATLVPHLAGERERAAASLGAARERVGALACVG